jgi:hypothetical protein
MKFVDAAKGSARAAQDGAQGACGVTAVQQNDHRGRTARATDAPKHAHGPHTHAVMCSIQKTRVLFTAVRASPCEPCAPGAAATGDSTAGAAATGAGAGGGASSRLIRSIAAAAAAAGAAAAGGLPPAASCCSWRWLDTTSCGAVGGTREKLRERATPCGQPSYPMRAAQRERARRPARSPALAVIFTAP